MSYFQLLSCNETLGTCCNDYGIIPILDIIRKVFDIFQIIVPILLIIGSTIQFVKLLTNPDEKGGTKKIINRLLAAVICFFLPTIVDVVMGLMGSNETFQVAACWDQAKLSNEIIRTQSATYIDKNNVKDKTSFLINPDEYETGTPPEEITETGNGQSTLLGAEIVVYAKRFIGKQYIYGGSWNGEEPYTGTDCSGFVQGVFKHFGINLQRTTSSQWNDKSSYTLVSPTDIRAGDLVMYDGHVGILTGIGTEVVHAKGSKWGIVLDEDYRTCSSHAILGIMRINGV